MRIAVFASLSVLFGLLVTACGGSTTDEGGAGTLAPVPRDQFAARFVAAVCDNVGPCCQAAGFAYDAAKCKQAGTAGLPADWDGSSPNLSYDGAAAAKCVAAVEAAAKGCGSIPVDAALACSNVFRGALPAGAACSAPSECAAPSRGWADCIAGVCEVKAPGKAGDTCDATCSGSELDSRCWGSASGGGGGTGGSAGSGGSTPPEPTTCWTEDGLACIDGACAAARAIGASCTFSECTGGAWCNGGTCEALAPVGQGCTSTGGCVPGATCQAGTCVARKPDGAPCAAHAECANHVCTAGKCGNGPIASAAVCDGTTAGGDANGAP